MNMKNSMIVVASDLGLGESIGNLVPHCTYISFGLPSSLSAICTIWTPFLDIFNEERAAW